MAGFTGFSDIGMMHYIQCAFTALFLGLLAPLTVRVADKCSPLLLGLQQEPY